MAAFNEFNSGMLKMTVTSGADTTGTMDITGLASEDLILYSLAYAGGTEATGLTSVTVAYSSAAKGVSSTDTSACEVVVFWLDKSASSN